MIAIEWNPDAILIGIPMVTVMLAGLFRLDERYASPDKPAERGHALCGWDENGKVLCIQPDGKVLRQAPQKRR